MKKIIPAATVILLLSGCVAANKPATNSSVEKKEATATTRVVKPITTAQIQPVRESADASQTQDYASRLMQCRKELDALQVYSKTKHQQLKSEFDKTALQLKKYLEVKNTIGHDINDLAMPKYQFAIRNVCFRIKTQLTNSIVSAS